MEVDLSITQSDQLIGKQWKCPRCGVEETITTDGIDHRGYKHWQYFNLKDLFDLQITMQDYARRERQILFRE